MSEKTSIIVTTHNYGDYLERCLNSLLSQSLQPLEIIVVNDSSSDDTMQIMDKYKSNNLMRYYDVDFGSAQKSRNFGLSKARGEYVLNMDADNYLDVRFLEKTQCILDDNKNVDLVYTDHQVFGEEQLISQTAQGKNWVSKEFEYNSLRQMNYIDTTSLVRKKDFRGFDERVRRFQDWDAWLTFLADKLAQRVPEGLLFKRLHEKSKTMTVQLYMERLRVMVKHKLIVTCHKKWLKKKFEGAHKKTIYIVKAHSDNLDFVSQVVKLKKSRNVLFYIIDTKEKNSSLIIMKKILREHDVVYRIVRGTIDGALKGIRMNNYLPAYSISYLFFVNNASDKEIHVPGRLCDMAYGGVRDIVDCPTLDKIDYMVFNKKGIKKFLNP